MIHNILRRTSRVLGIFLGSSAVIARSFDAMDLPTATWFMASACFWLLSSRDGGAKGEG